MSDNLMGNRFFGHRKPGWHMKGTVSDNDMTAVETLELLGNYWFEQRPVKGFLNGDNRELGDYFIVRSATSDDPQERNFGYTTDHYKMMQPLRICEMFDESVSQPVETMGMLGLGEKLFLTWELEPFTVGKEDQVKPYGFIACGFDGKYGSSLNVVMTRVVCQNTWKSAIYEAENTKEQGRGKIWSGKHTSTNLEVEFQIWMNYVQVESEKRNQTLNATFNELAKISIKRDEANSFVSQLFPYPLAVPDYYPDQLRVKKQEKIDSLIDGANKNREGVLTLYDGQGTAIDATAWGLFNAVTEWENWGLDSKKPVENSILFGSRSAAMSKAYNIITENYL